MQQAVVLHCLEGFLQLGRNAKRESINHHPTILFDDSRGFSSMVGSCPDELPRAKRESALALGREIKRERERESGREQKGTHILMGFNETFMELIAEICKTVGCSFE